MKAQIKAFYAAHKTAIIIGALILVIGSKSFTEGFKSTYDPQGYGQSMCGQNQQDQRPQSFWGKVFGGGNENGNANYNNGGSANQYYPSNGGGASYAGNSGADYTSGYDKQQASLDRTSENYSDYMRDQANYEDGEGNQYKLSSNYSNSYVNNTTGEYVQSNDANYDPNAGSTSTWTSVTPSSTYSSYSSTAEGE